MSILVLKNWLISKSRCPQKPFLWGHLSKSRCPQKNRPFEDIWWLIFGCDYGYLAQKEGVSCLVANTHSSVASRHLPYLSWSHQIVLSHTFDRLWTCRQLLSWSHQIVLSHTSVAVKISSLSLSWSHQIVLSHTLEWVYRAPLLLWLWHFEKSDFSGNQPISVLGMKCRLARRVLRHRHKSFSQRIQSHIHP